MRVIVNRSEENIYVFTPDLSSYEKIKATGAYVCSAVHPNGIKYIYNSASDRSNLIDKEGKILADLKMGFNVQICGNFILESKGADLYVLDLSPFITK